MRIYALQLSEDGSRLIYPTLIKTLKPHTTPVITTAIDKTGTLVATGGADGVIKIWDIKAAYLTHTFRGHAGVISALHFFQPTKSRLGPELISKRKRKESQELNHLEGEANGDTKSTLFRLASGSEDGKIRIWDLEKRKSISTLDSHVSVVRSLDFSVEESTLVSASRDKTAILWDARSWKVKKVFPVLEGLESVGFLETGTLIYTGGENGRLRIWETQSGREITQEQDVGNEGDGIVHVLQNANLEVLLCIHADQTLILHSTSPVSNITPGATIEPLPTLRRISGTHDEIIDLAYVAPERTLLALATNSEDIRLVSLNSEGTVQSSTADSNYFGADVALLRGHKDIIICLDVDWSGCWLATGAKDNTARLWRIDHATSTYKCVTTFTGHAESLGAISLSCTPPPIGSAAYTDPLSHAPSFLLTGSQDRTIKRWDISKSRSSKSEKKSPRAMYTRKAHEKDINAISTNHNSNLFASASQDRTVKIWSAEEGEVQGVLRGHRRGVWSVKFAPRDTPTITGDNGPASSSRGLILTGSGDKTVKIWSLTDYSCLRTLEGHTNSVLKVLWIPVRPSNDSEAASAPKRNTIQIVSAGGDGLVKVWDASAGEVSCTLDNHTDRVWALTVNPESNTLVSGGGDSTVTFWKDTTSLTLAATAAASTAQVEQEQLLQNYVHRGNYREAITLALQLNHPARLLALLQKVVDTQPPEEGSLSGLKAVDEVLAGLADEQLLVLLGRVRDWNTNVRTAVVAQRVLGVIVRLYPAARLAALKGRGWKEVLEGLKAYTERHYRRVEELVDESYIVEYTLREMEEVSHVGEQVDGRGGDIIMV